MVEDFRAKYFAYRLDPWHPQALEQYQAYFHTGPSAVLSGQSSYRPGAKRIVRRRKKVTTASSTVGGENDSPTSSVSSISSGTLILSEAKLVPTPTDIYVRDERIHTVRHFHKLSKQTRIKSARLEELLDLARLWITDKCTNSFAVSTVADIDGKTGSTNCDMKISSGVHSTDFLTYCFVHSEGQLDKLLPAKEYKTLRFHVLCCLHAIWSKLEMAVITAAVGNANTKSDTKSDVKDVEQSTMRAATGYVFLQALFDRLCRTDRKCLMQAFVDSPGVQKMWSAFIMVPNKMQSMTDQSACTTSRQEWIPILFDRPELYEFVKVTGLTSAQKTQLLDAFYWSVIHTGPQNTATATTTDDERLGTKVYCTNILNQYLQHGWYVVLEDYKARNVTKITVSKK